MIRKMAKLIPVKPHSYSKYEILRGLLTESKIDCYVETHAGTAKVLDVPTGLEKEGSMLIAAKSQPSAQIYGIEIDPGRYSLLLENMKLLTNVECIHGDCNMEIMKLIPALVGKRVLFNVDPHGLIYRRGKVRTHELRWETIVEITKHPDSSLLLTLPILAIFRNAGDALKRLATPSAIQRGQNVAIFFGDEDWRTAIRKVGDHYAWVRYFMRKALLSYQFKGAILLRAKIPTRPPVLYLVFASNNEKLAERARGLMCREAGQPCKGSLFYYQCNNFCQLNGFILDGALSGKWFQVG